MFDNPCRQHGRTIFRFRVFPATRGASFRKSANDARTFPCSKTRTGHTFGILFVSFSLSLSLSLSVSPSPVDTLHVARAEEIHAPRCILEQFPPFPPPRAFTFSLERARSGSGGLEIYAPRISLLVYTPRSYGSRSSLERTTRIEISRLDISLLWSSGR